jgi:hypothetical protein
VELEPAPKTPLAASCAGDELDEDTDPAAAAVAGPDVAALNAGVVFVVGLVVKK